MIKLIRLLVLFVIICLIYGLGSAFNGDSSKPSERKVPTKELSTENVGNSFSESDENIELNTNSEEKIADESKLTGVVDRDKSYQSNGMFKIDEPVKNDKQVIESKKDVPVMEEEIVQEEQQVEEKKEEKNEENIEIKNIQENEEIIKEAREVIDYELERLKEQVEYATYDECMEIGFEKAIEDSVGILGFSCPYIAYKGNILGYRLQLDYTNPMEEVEEEKQPEFAFFL